VQGPGEGRKGSSGGELINHLEVPEVGADEVREAADLHRHRLPHPCLPSFVAPTAEGGLWIPLGPSCSHGGRRTTTRASGVASSAAAEHWRAAGGGYGRRRRSAARVL
jgi:hypothetical protein